LVAVLIRAQDAYTLYHKQHEHHLSQSTGPALPALGHALAGSTGTAISNLCIYPLDLIITRLQVQRQLRKSSSTPDDGEYKGILDAADQIYNKEGGISAFYIGIVQDTTKSIADSFLFFWFYNYLRQKKLQKQGITTTTLPVLDELAVGALAGACSKFFTTPISNIVTRKQTASMVSARSGSNHNEPSVQEIASHIQSEKGIQGFWSGYSASLVLTLNPSITFFLYETLKRTLLPRSRRDDPGARLTFLMAAVSKAIASTITYPFSLAKARAQVGSKPPINPNAASEIKSEISAASSSSKDAGVKKREEEAKNASKNLKRTAARSTVFSTILHIYRTEGPQALYEGVWGEILKGFFSHGITMLVKEAVHKSIIQLYFLLLRAIGRMPTASEAVSQAQRMAQNATVQAQKVGAKTGEMAQTAYVQAAESVSGAYSNATQTMGSVVAGAKRNVGQAYDGAQNVRGNVSEAAKSGSDIASQEAGHLLGNAQEMLGKNLEEAGKGIRPSKEEGGD
jgi:cell division septum initiation protein DivIVA